LGPIRPKISPELTVMDMPATAVTLPNRRDSSNVSTTAEGSCTGLGVGASSGIVIHHLITWAAQKNPKPFATVTTLVIAGETLNPKHGGGKARLRHIIVVPRP
jgi:hypothetical protein